MHHHADVVISQDALRQAFVYSQTFCLKNLAKLGFNYNCHFSTDK